MKKHFTATFFFLAFSFTLVGQDTPVVEKADTADIVYTVVETMPQYVGGQEAMMDFIRKNTQYPAEAKKQGVSGRVYVSFVIDKTGQVTEASVMRGIGGGCDAEALRVVNAMPAWAPGTQSGKPVKVRFVLPFSFAFDNTPAVEDSGKEKSDK